ncbi:MAG: hypothetical protein HC853_12305 [Anaerolineae bacterium]|nr:hypothetical protein [Anaerolineae bacterium]
MRRLQVLKRLGRHLHWLWALMWFSLVTCVVTYPVVFCLNACLPGDDFRVVDTREAVWAIWWWKRALIDLHQSPTAISMLNFPDGLRFPLFPAMVQTFIFATPLAALFSPVIAYNSLFLASFAFSGLSGYALCMAISRDRVASLFGGVVWSFFANKMGHALGGHFYFLVVFTLPLLPLAVLWLLNQPSRLRATITGSVIACVAAVHPTYTVYFVAPMLVALIGPIVLRDWRNITSSAQLRACLFALIIAAVLYLPLLLPVLVEITQGRAQSLKAPPDAVYLSVDALSFFIPPPQNPVTLASGLNGLATKSVYSLYESLGYIGWIAIGLAVIGAVAHWREVRVWVILALCASVFALGPLLKVAGNIVRIGDAATPISLPYAFLSQLPFLEWGRTPGRVFVLIMLPVAVLASIGLKFALQRRFLSSAWVRFGLA